MGFNSCLEERMKKYRDEISQDLNNQLFQNEKLKMYNNNNEEIDERKARETANLLTKTVNNILNQEISIKDEKIKIKDFLKDNFNIILKDIPKKKDIEDLGNVILKIFNDYKTSSNQLNFNINELKNLFKEQHKLYLDNEGLNKEEIKELSNKTKENIKNADEEKKQLYIVVNENLEDKYNDSTTSGLSSIQSEPTEKIKPIIINDLFKSLLSKNKDSLNLTKVYNYINDPDLIREVFKKLNDKQKKETLKKLKLDPITENRQIILDTIDDLIKK